jgi:hypothetical protein
MSMMTTHYTGPSTNSSSNSHPESAPANGEREEAVSPSHNDIICSHLYNNGYINGLYSDLILRISCPSMPAMDGVLFKLHRLLAMRSPLLASMLQDYEKLSSSHHTSGASPVHPVSLTLTITDPHITPEGLGIAMGHLYASYSASLLKSNRVIGAERATVLTSVLCSASLLRLADLAHIATQLMKQELNVQTARSLAMFVSHPESDKYGSAITELRETVHAFLTRGILQTLTNPWDKEGDDYQLLVQVFSSLPFEWLKKIVESEEFQVPSNMERWDLSSYFMALH